MKRPGKDVIGALFWLAMGIFFAIGGLRLNPGSLRQPGPGFLPLVMASLLICFSLFIVAKGVIRPESPLKDILWRNQLVAVASVFIFGVLLDLIGFFLATFILLSILFGLLFTGRRRWLRTLFYAAITALVGWYLFSVILRVPFPRAPLTVIWR